MNSGSFFYRRVKRVSGLQPNYALLLYNFEFAGRCKCPKSTRERCRVELMHISGGGPAQQDLFTTPRRRGEIMKGDRDGWGAHQDVDGDIGG